MADEERVVSVRLVEGLRAEGSDGTHTVTLDEPVADGGTDQGMTPMKLFLTSLGSCSAITIRLYAQRKGWDLQGAEVTVRLTRSGPKEPPTIVQEVHLEGDLDEAQRDRLLQIAGRCPVHRVVDGPRVMEERFA